MRNSRMLFSLDYDLLLYDVTSTYFEGQAEANDLVQPARPQQVCENRPGRG